MDKENNLINATRYVAGSIGPLLGSIAVLNTGVLGHGVLSFVILGVTMAHGYVAQISFDNLWFVRRSLWSGQGIWVRLLPESMPPPLLWEHSDNTLKGSEL